MNGPQQTVRRLAAVLEQAMHDGELRCDDPLFAAETLQSMLLGAERLRRLYVPDQAALPVPADADRVIDLFLRAYAPQNHE